MNTNATHLFGGALFFAGLTTGGANSRSESAKRGRTRIAALVATASLVSVSPALADIIHVPNDFPTIQGAIDASVDDDEIVVAPGTFVESIDFLGKTIIVRSSDGAAVTTIEGAGSTVVTCANYEGSDTVFQGFTVTGGVTGMSNDGFAEPMVIDCTFTDNDAYGMTNSLSYATIVGCTFSNNGIGAYNYFSGDATFIDCAFTGNAVGSWVVESDPTLVGCTFANNSFDGAYNGAFARSTFRRCSFIANGGGIFNSLWGCAIVSNCAISGNGGWGIVSNSYKSYAAIWNCAITGNSDGGILHNDDTYIDACTVAGNGGWGIALGGFGNVGFVSSCVVWGNSLGSIDGASEDVRYSDIEGGFAGEGNIDADPLFNNPKSGDYRLSAGSPCIDAGDNTGWGPCYLDLRGRFRLFDDPDTRDTGLGDPPIIDMGAYEFGSPLADDCNGNAMDDACDIENGTSQDDNANGIPDECEKAECPWDLDDDEVVGTGDLILLLGSWGDPYGTADLIELLGNWGPCR